MELADFVRIARRESALSFLVVGSFAGAAHGYVRPTFEVDFLVCGKAGNGLGLMFVDEFSCVCSALRSGGCLGEQRLLFHA